MKAVLVWGQAKQKTLVLIILGVSGVLGEMVFPEDRPWGVRYFENSQLCGTLEQMNMSG